MLPCLLLALALLGTAPASRPAPASPEAEVAALEVPEEEEEDARCPLASETRAFSLADPLAATTYRYVVVTRCQTIHSAELPHQRLPAAPGAALHQPRAGLDRGRHPPQGPLGAVPLGRRQPLQLRALAAGLPAALPPLLHRALHQQRALEKPALPGAAALHLRVLRGSAPPGAPRPAAPLGTPLLPCPPLRPHGGGLHPHPGSQ
ncbi:bone marrow proteoglycan isoform X1 [Opisthocomus hoazin]|uniref:bone marrow proteoglycan isoform X1 n=1 Tax=Opisthocomus hoazin TaxID=30419 RepID=UPI003F531812